MEVYLRLESPEVFDLIRNHGLFSLVQNKAAQLMRCGPPTAAALLAGSKDINPHTVLKFLSDNHQHQYMVETVRLPLTISIWRRSALQIHKQSRTSVNFRC
jgi:hypothetical protein